MVEQVTGMDFFTYVQQTLLAASRDYGGASVRRRVANGRPINQAIAEDGEYGLSALDVTSTVPVPFRVWW